MKKISISLLILASIIPAADFKTGLDAYNRGDYAAALKEWQPLAEKGDPNAAYNVGLLYARGQGMSQNYQQAADWYRKAADQGVAAAQYNLGVIYANGQGVTRDQQEAAKWFLKAADQGVRDAATGLGHMYYEGEGAFKNYGEAEKWYRKAAGNGVASAAFSLGVMYDLGQGVPKDYTEAIKWYRKAADAGYPAALTNIGILYYNAQGVKRDLIQAYAWIARAQKLGDPRAAELISSVTSKMPARDLKKAQVVAADWQAPSAPPPQVADSRLFKQPPTTTSGTIPAATTSPATSPASNADRTAPAAAPAATPKHQDEEPSPYVWNHVDRVIAVGDVHGDYEQFAAVLQSAGLIDGNGNWTGGKTHLVQTGDVLDRGPDSRAVMDLLMRLEKQAAAAGGAVHALVGNHEAMNLYGDLRYVSPGEFASFAPKIGEANREAAYQPVTDPVEAVEPLKDAPPAKVPGSTERAAAFAPEGVYGKWLRGHDTAVKIDRTLFLHAGLGKKFADWPLDRINHEVSTELNDFSKLHGGAATDEEGPLWYRGLASGDEQLLQPVVDQLLKNFDVDRIVVGHTYAQAAITPRFQGKVILIDIGLSRVYDNVGKMGCLEIDGDKIFALHRGQKLELPKDEGADMLRYLKQAAALDPQPSPLVTRIHELEK